LALRAITGLIALAALLYSLGCAGGDSNIDQSSGASGEAATPTSSTETQAAAKQPTVTKKYFEDIIGDPEEPEEEYRYWDYRFTFERGRTYRARIYTDTPDEANVFRLDIKSPLFPVDDPSERAYLRVIRRVLATDGWHVDISVLRDEGYVTVALD
jgi:hypothetical protein